MMFGSAELSRYLRTHSNREGALIVVRSKLSHDDDWRWQRVEAYVRKHWLVLASEIPLTLTPEVRDLGVESFRFEANDIVAR